MADQVRNEMNTENSGVQTKTSGQDQTVPQNITDLCKAYDEIKNDNKGIKRQLNDLLQKMDSSDERARKIEEKQQKIKEGMKGEQDKWQKQMFQFQQDVKKQLTDATNTVKQSDERTELVQNENECIQSKMTTFSIIFYVTLAVIAVALFFIQNGQRRERLLDDEVMDTINALQTNEKLMYQQLEDVKSTCLKEIEEMSNKMGNIEKQNQILPLTDFLVATDFDESTKRAVSSSAMIRQISKIKAIQDKSSFEVHVINPIPLLHNNTMYVDKYDTVITACEYLDLNKGIYTTPIKGSFSFKLWMKQEGDGDIEWYLCSNRDGGKEKVKDAQQEESSDWYYAVFNWKCNGKEKVWVEAFTTDKDTKVELKWSGRLEEIE